MTDSRCLFCDNSAKRSGFASAGWLYLCFAGKQYGFIRVIAGGYGVFFNGGKVVPDIHSRPTDFEQKLMKENARQKKLLLALFVLSLPLFLVSSWLSIILIVGTAVFYRKNMLREKLISGSIGNNAESQFELHKILKNSGNNEASIAFLELSAENGNPGAQYELYLYYLNGVGAEGKEELAEQWLNRAVSGNFSAAKEIVESRRKMKAEQEKLERQRKELASVHLLSAPERFQLAEKYIHAEETECDLDVAVMILRTFSRQWDEGRTITLDSSPMMRRIEDCIEQFEMLVYGNNRRERTYIMDGLKNANISNHNSALGPFAVGPLLGFVSGIKTTEGAAFALIYTNLCNRYKDMYTLQVAALKHRFDILQFFINALYKSLDEVGMAYLGEECDYIIRKHIDLK